MSSKTVVIVEDETETAEMLAEMMRIMGYKVYQSSGGLQAIDLIAQKKPTTILLDQMLPGVSGLDVLHSIRLDERLCKIPVIIVSAKALPSDKQKGLQAGAARYLVKPVAFHDLRTAIEQVTVFSQPASNRLHSN